MSLKSRIERLEARVPSHGDFADFSKDERDVGVLVLTKSLVASGEFSEEDRASKLAQIAEIESRYSPAKIAEISARIVPSLEEYAMKLEQQQ